MSRIYSWTLTAILIGMLLCGIAAAQPPDATSKPRKQKKEPSKLFEDWISKDVPYIATDEEKKAFRLLTTDEERENFIRIFWDLRDPDPDTAENEYREEYYERIAYANENFASGKPGWMTDRGRIYITWGKPDSVETHPSGGSYDRPAWEGGGTTTTYPFEIWFYRGKDGLPNGAEFEFVDPSGSGEYRLTANPNDKDALLFVPGAGETTRERLGLDSRADRIAGINSRNYMREQDSPFSKIELINRARRPPPVRATNFEGTLEDSPVIDNNPLEFDMRIDFFRQGEDRVVATFTLLTENKELAFVDEGGVRAARLNVLGRIRSVAERPAGEFQDSVVAYEKDTQAPGERKSIYQSSKSLSPGRYKVSVTVTDVESGSKGRRELSFEVPDYATGKLSTSTLVLASTLREAGLNETGARFVIGGRKVVPNLTGEFRSGQDLGMYLQVYNAGIDQTTLAPAVDATYEILKDGKAVRSFPENWSGLSESGARLTLARTFSTAGLEPGSYELEVRIKDLTGVSAEIIQRAPFALVE